MGHRVWFTAGTLAVVGALGLIGSGRSVVQANESVTFTEDVAPIVLNRCATCHRPGEAAPFSLLTYDDVKRRGTLIARAVSSRAMPPWKAVVSDFAYKEDRRLSESEIDTITRW